MDACEGDSVCMFDASQSGSLDVGISSHETKIKNEEIEAAIGEFLKC